MCVSVLFAGGLDGTPTPASSLTHPHVPPYSSAKSDVRVSRPPREKMVQATERWPDSSLTRAHKRPRHVQSIAIIHPEASQDEVKLGCAEEPCFTLLGVRL